MFLKDKLQTLKMKEGENITKHIHKFLYLYNNSLLQELLYKVIRQYYLLWKVCLQAIDFS